MNSPAKHVPLFVYGELKSKTHADNVTAPGELRHRGRDAAAHFGPHHKTKVKGQIRHIPTNKLQSLDKYEAPEYKRVMVHTSHGHAFAYHYVKGDFDKMKPAKVLHGEEDIKDNMEP